MPIVVDSEVHHFNEVLVWNKIGGAYRPYVGRVTVTDPISGTPVQVTKDGSTASFFTATNGDVSFTAGQGAVVLNAPGLAVTVRSVESALL